MNDRLYDYIMSLTLVDSYELLPPRPELRSCRDAVAELLSDSPAEALTAAGLPAESLELARGSRLSVREKWKLVSPYWSLVAHTGACRAAELAARELYGIDRINDETIEAYDAAFRTTFGSQRYEYILKERCNIEFALLFDGSHSAQCRGAVTPPDMTADKRYFKTAGDICRLVSPSSVDDTASVGSEAGVKVSAFDDYLNACDKILRRISKHSRVICCTEAPIPVPTSYSDARSAFDAMTAGSRGDIREAIRSYVYRYLLELAAKLRLTVRVDDGGAASAGYAEIFKLYPELKFDVLVSRAPGRRELSRYAAVLPNVYANLSRMPALASEYLRFTPYNKLICFGGGCTTIDAVYGQVLIMRETLARVLNSCISWGILDRKRAESAARALLYENARSLYN